MNKDNKKYKNALQENIEQSVGQYVFKLCFMSTYGTIKRISTSVGYDKLSTTFENILRDNPINSVKLIDLSIKLDHYNKFPIKDIEDAKKMSDNNFLAFLTLQNLVMNYLYMYNTDYKVKAKICSLLNIEMKDQLLIDLTSKVKRE